ncbi:hypothetical protein CTI12_AA352830 [Artemisia annua]|uniref:Helitron helicase-like domain-containing protein n=1 Tax=Artemisia annua TaxID=35608 RepID=A0A2U1MQD3_ARTAN|nr:hypothetical protein CTI12_AA352830 [Artemisia annua]
MHVRHDTPAIRSFSFYHTLYNNFIPRAKKIQKKPDTTHIAVKEKEEPTLYKPAHRNTSYGKFLFNFLPYYLLAFPPFFCANTLCFSAFNMRTKAKARPRVGSVRSLESIDAVTHSEGLHSEDVTTVSKENVSHINEPVAQSPPFCSNGCHTHCIASGNPTEMSPNNLSNEALQCFNDPVQLSSARKRKAACVYKLPAVPLDKGHSLSSETEPHSKRQHGQPTVAHYSQEPTTGLVATSRKKKISCTNEPQLQYACAMPTEILASYKPATPVAMDKGKRRLPNDYYNEDHITELVAASAQKKLCLDTHQKPQHTPTMTSGNVTSSAHLSPTILDKGKRKIFEDSGSNTSVSHQETLLSQPCYRPNDPITDLLSDELLCDIEANDIYDLNECYASPYDNPSSARRPTEDAATKQRQQMHRSQVRSLASTTNEQSTRTANNRSRRSRQARPSLNGRSHADLPTNRRPRQRQENMIRNGEGLRRDIVEGLIEFLDEHNELIQLFRTARNKMADANIPNFKVKLFGVVGSKQHELPSGDAIGAIVFEGGPDVETDFDIVIEKHSGTAQRVNKLNPSYMSLQFPLIFIYGEAGYHLGLTLSNARNASTDGPKKMSMKMFYAYQLHDRQGQKMDEASSIVTSAKSTGKEIITEPESINLAMIKPSDIGKVLYVKAYRKWTVTTKNGKPTLFCCMFIDQQILQQTSLHQASIPEKVDKHQLPATPPEHETNLPQASKLEDQNIPATESKIKYGPRKASAHRMLFSQEKDLGAEKGSKRTRKEGP